MRTRIGARLGGRVKTTAVLTTVLMTAALVGVGRSASANTIKGLTNYDRTGAQFGIKFQLKTYKSSTVVGGNFNTKLWVDKPTAQTPTLQTRSFCVDVLRALSSTPQYVTLTNENGRISSDAVGIQRNIGAAGWLAKTYQGSANDGVSKAALQLAIWEAIYDNDGNLGAGNFKLLNLSTLNSSVKTLAQSYLTAALQAGNGQFAKSLVTFINFRGCSQDQIACIIPEPASWTMISLAAAGFVGLRVKRRRARQTASA